MPPLSHNRIAIDPSKINRSWDAIVIGAGPAGSMLSFQLASKHKTVLLIDKASFPRQKVCGCCLNHAALTCLATHGMAGLTEQLQAVPLHELSLFTRKTSAQLPLPAAKSLSREALDAAMVDRAIETGTVFLPHTLASVGPTTKDQRTVTITYNESKTELHARAVVVADGISGRSLEQLNDFSSTVSTSSRIGVGTVIDCADPFYQSGIVYMASGTGGYVGLVRLENNRLNVAAALDLSYSRKCGGPAKASVELLREVGLPIIDELLIAEWQGTGALTKRRRRIAAERLFVIGDAASYAEPFTGEGMAWALLSATLVAPLVLAAITQWSDLLALQWTSLHTQTIGKRQFISMAIATILKYPSLTTICTSIANRIPTVASNLIRYISAESQNINAT